MSSTDFRSCVLEPIEDSESSSVECVNGKWRSSSFFLDSSGRSVVSLPLRLRFSSPDVLDQFLADGSLSPAPGNEIDAASKVSSDEKNEEDGEEEKSTDDGSDQPQGRRRCIGIEARVTLTSGNGQAITAKVEDVHILSIKAEDDLQSVSLSTEIVVRVSQADDASKQQRLGDVKASMDVGASLTEQPTQSLDPAQSALELLDSLNQSDALAPQKPTITQLEPFPLQVTLTHAFEIAVRSVPGPTMGQTFLSISMKHANTHQQPVTITAIALHPGVSWYTRQQQQQQGSSAVMSPKSYAAATAVVTEDLSSVVQWRYSPGCAPQLPLQLHPHEAVAVCLTMDASGDTISRLCACPVSITADVVLGRERRHEIVAAAEAHWQTARTAVEPADAFRVDLRILEGTERTVVGAPVTVALEITNLQQELRQLMLLVDQPAGLGKWSVVSEKGGQKFGLVGGDDERSDLLVIDNALILGELKGRASMEAKIRLIPLREGTTNVPNFKLIDSRTGKRYACIHKLQTVVEAAPQ